MNWTIARRIGIGTALILVLTVVVAVIGMVSLVRTTAAFRVAVAQQRDVLLTGESAESEARQANADFLRFLIDRDEVDARSMDSTTAESRALLGRAGEGASDEGRQLWREAQELLDQWKQAADASIAAARAGDGVEAERIRDERTRPLRLSLRAAIDRGLARADSIAEYQVRGAEAAARRSEQALLAGAALALLLGTISALLLNRAVSGRLRESTGVLASSAAEIVAASAQQAASAAETSAAVMQTSTTVDEVAQTAEQAAERARGVAASAQRAAEIGTAGRRAVDASAAEMGNVRAQVEGIADNILVLAEQAQAIGDIITAVDDIADQTNLLALNAAVEAARAGEHGRGFAVVAAEVRSLADQSKRATVQVRQILGDIQRATSAAVLTTERGTQQVGTATRQVSEAGETIRALEAAVADSAQAAAQIVASAGQQAVGMIQIRQAMESIQEATQQNLASTRQAEQAAQDLDRLGNRLLELVSGNGHAPVARRPRT